MSDICSLPGFAEFFKDFLKDGIDAGGTLIYNYDDEHKKKLAELLDKDERYYYYIQILCDIDPEDDRRYVPDSDLQIINVDHFGINAAAKDKADQIRTNVYDVIDRVYADQDNIDLDYETWTIDDTGNGEGEYCEGYLDFLERTGRA